MTILKVLLTTWLPFIQHSVVSLKVKGTIPKSCVEQNGNTEKKNAQSLYIFGYAYTF